MCRDCLLCSIYIVVVRTVLICIIYNAMFVWHSACLITGIDIYGIMFKGNCIDKDIGCLHIKLATPTYGSVGKINF